MRNIIVGLTALSISAFGLSAAVSAAPVVHPYEVPEAPGISQEIWAKGLARPWGIAFLPDGRMLVSEKSGRMRLIAKNGRVGPPIAGVPAVAEVGQGGLLDVAPHPDFARNGLVYFTHAVGNADQNHTALSRGKLSGNMLTDVQELFRNPTPKKGGQHFGSRILFLPDNSLLMSVGDGGNPPLSLGDDFIRQQAQNPRTLFGKVLRLSDEGKPVKFNPGVQNPKSGWNPLVHSIGHRNVQGLARDPKTGAIWATEHGARGGDELNRIVGGGNYGWPVITYSVEYSGKPITGERSRQGMRDAALVWVPSIAPSGLAVYRGRTLPGLDGRILAGGLMSEDVRVIAAGPNGERLSEQRVKIGARVRSIAVGPDGLVYLVTDEDEGRIIRLKPGK